MSKPLSAIMALVLAAIACDTGVYYVNPFANQQVSTTEAYGEKVQATERALEALKAQATINAALPDDGSVPEQDAPADEFGCATDAECSNSGTHVYAMSVLDTAQCTAGGGGQVLQEFEFEQVGGSIFVEGLGFAGLTFLEGCIGHASFGKP